jgi:SAM-dependent methyltransferase
VTTPSFPPLPSLLSLGRPAGGRTGRPLLGSRGSRARHATARVLPRRRAGKGDQDGATLHEFVRRAADEARSRGAATLEVGLRNGPSHGELFDDDDYEAVFLRLPAAGPRFVPSAELPVASERFGVVLCTDVVHRAVEPRGVLSELNRVLEPRGKVFLSTPLVVPEPAVTATPRPARYGLNYVMEASGFRIEAVTALGGGSRCYGIVAGKKDRVSGASPSGRQRPVPGR